ncbi:MAG: VWA domain-containing protein [Rhodocyclaceae bacterium]|nr:VWA domain-containing protein [Rhodocyclaceae bacterium]
MTDLRQRLRCSVAQIDDIFPDCLAEAQTLLSPAGIERWLDGASAVCGLGRGQDLPLIYLQIMPRAARIVGEALFDDTSDLAGFLSRAGSAKAIAPLLSTLPACVRRLETMAMVGAYFDLIRRIAQEAPTGLAPFLLHADHLLGSVCIGGIRNWVAFGLRAYRGQEHKAADYFSLQTADARAALQRERKGTLLADAVRALRLTLRAFWSLDDELLPFSTAFDIDRLPMPHLDKEGFHLPDVYLPDVYEEAAGLGGVISGLDRYRATLAHLAAHRLWTKPLIADNFNRYQQLIIETFEDARVEWLALQRYPGLRRLWLALHPIPREGDCPPGHSCIRHKATLLARALLDPGHGYRDPTLLDFVARFHARMAQDPHDTAVATELGIAYLVNIHEVDFRSPKVYFRDTQVSYRDDNRYLWIFLEDTDEEDDFYSDHHVINPKKRQEDAGTRFARHQPEWDYLAATYRPDWATVYESVQASGDPAIIDRIVERHAPLVRRLRQLVDLLKPQGRVRVRYREEGDELDLDTALRAIVDHRAGTTPDPRIHQSHRPDGRDIALLLLIDLSNSVNDKSADGTTTILELSREAVALLGQTLALLGDPCAIAGFASNTRHEVRHFHFKGFGEPWNDEVKARIAGMQGALSTRMGAALRHAGHTLAHQPAEKKLLLLLTDGEPADIDVDDPIYLRADARKAVEELAGRGIQSFCLSLDANADDYVRDIFGHRYRVLDRIEQLPEKLPTLYLQLTR